LQKVKQQRAEFERARHYQRDEKLAKLTHVRSLSEKPEQNSVENFFKLRVSDNVQVLKLDNDTDSESKPNHKTEQDALTPK
jgi:hypothetical protein